VRDARVVEQPVLTSALAATAGGADVAVFTSFSPLWDSARVSGPAFTVKGAPGDNLALHRALAGAPTGSVLVADVQDGVAHGHWGDLMTQAAEVRGLSGLVIRGSIRDCLEITARRFPVFHRGTAPAQAAKTYPGELATTLQWEGGSVSSGDLVIADCDGVVAVPAALVETLLVRVEEIEAAEAVIRARLASGETTLEVLGLSAE
jgi:4-hydroxy-4-methyl-2-oxoglutarate aldolase